jgi:hypothetical protein
MPISTISQANQPPQSSLSSWMFRSAQHDRMVDGLGLPKFSLAFAGIWF